MEKIPENLVTEGLFFNKKWMSCSMLILINQLWQMVILLFKRDLEKLNSRWFKNSLRIVEANLKKKKQKAEQNTLKFALFVLAEASLKTGSQLRSQVVTGTFPLKCSFQGLFQCAIVSAQEIRLVVQPSFNLKNSNLLLSQEIMLLKINVLEPEAWIITRFLGGSLAEFCKTCAVCLLKAYLWGSDQYRRAETFPL